MKLTKCEQGHFFDGDKYPACPYCNTDLQNETAIVHTSETTPAEAADPEGPVTGWLVVVDGRPGGVTCGWASAAAFWGWMPPLRRSP